MITIACATKFWAFHLAEQFDKKALLDNLLTVYHSGKNPSLARFNSRIDSELIDLNKIESFPFLALLYKLGKDSHRNNNLFDALTANYIRRHSDYKVFIGWSGMSLKSMQRAKKDGKLVILERGSSHIRYQYSILQEEYSKWGFHFESDERVASKEEQEYELADYITIPSGFVRNSFLLKGFKGEKLFTNNFGVSKLFQPTKPKSDKFTILYLGTLSLRKGLPYLFEALVKLNVDPKQFDVYFVGEISDEIKTLLPKYKATNWIFTGHVSHHELPDYISSCSVAVHPSVEEGLSMVIPQVMSCGVPLIATCNTGGEDLITNGIDGFIVPIQSPDAIANCLTRLYEDRDLLKSMQLSARNKAMQLGSWDSYGDRYAEFILSKITR